MCAIVFSLVDLRRYLTGAAVMSGEASLGGLDETKGNGLGDGLAGLLHNHLYQSTESQSPRRSAKVGPTAARTLPVS